MTSMHNWSDLPDDLLHVVYVKVPGLLHRIRFAAVCRSWRASAIAPGHTAPPTVPWLLFSSSRGNGVDDFKTKNIYCPEDDQFLHIPLPSIAIGKRFVGAYDGGWVAMLGQDMQLAVVNLFSGAEVPLPAKDMSTVSSGGSSNIIQKVVFSESPTISGCMLAAIIPQCGIAICRVGCKDSTWTVKQLAPPRLKDIVFCNGQLYGLTLFEGVIKFDIGVNEDGRPRIMAKMWSKAVYVPMVRRDGVQSNCIYTDNVTYLVKLDDHGDHICPTLGESSEDAMQQIKSAGTMTVPHSSTGMWVLPPDF
ncbi:uncharacterized protein [Aegilops tauschii subsp. strangulata]|uniref:uncharacterized protein n=1 Tax=Aegilops tauschii subsp. strangulata TaxID=200361 RepID=UPI003CC8A200